MVTQVNIITAILSYLLGLVSGMFLHRLTRTKDIKINDIVLMAVTIIWMATRTFGMINTAYQPSPLVDGLMGMIVGFFYKGAALPFKKP